MVPWPISTAGDMMVATPSLPMETQALAVKSAAASAGRMVSSEPKVTAMPAALEETRKLRRESAWICVVMIRPPPLSGSPR